MSNMDFVHGSKRYFWVEFNFLAWRQTCFEAITYPPSFPLPLLALSPLYGHFYCSSCVISQSQHLEWIAILCSTGHRHWSCTKASYFWKSFLLVVLLGGGAGRLKLKTNPTLRASGASNKKAAALIERLSLSLQQKPNIFLFAPAFSHFLGNL